MLELRPNCEYCDKDLAPDALDARICSYECTFCAACVENYLSNVCPNCGGGFVARPVRPKVARRQGVSLADDPAGTTRRQLKYSAGEVATFAAMVKDIAPQDR